MSNRDGNFDIYVMNADGSNQTRLTNNPGHEEQHRWSPDGSKIAFMSNRDGNFEIYVVNADGSNLTNLTSNPGHDRYHQWSPDGSKIAFRSSRDGADWDIYVMDADGSNQIRLTNNTFILDKDPAWSPDGGKIAFMSTRNTPLLAPGGPPVAGPRNHDIYIMDADGANQTRLTHHSAVGDNVLRLPKWSSDGNKIAFWSNSDVDYEIYVMNADGSNQINVTNSPGGDGAHDWSPGVDPWSWRGMIL